MLSQVVMSYQLTEIPVREPKDKQQDFNSIEPIQLGSTLHPSGDPILGDKVSANGTPFLSTVTFSETPL